MESIFLTDRGKVRQHNEDNGAIFQHSDKETLAIVADGMGGHRAGDVASEMAVSEFQILWETKEIDQKPDEVEKWLEKSVKQVNEKVFQYSQEHEECQGMGTTIVIAVCTKEFVTIAHIGDSRCYLKNSNGFTQKTADHSLVYELVRTGQISKEDAEFHPRKNVLMRALGTEKEVHIDIQTFMWEEGDCLLLCSDGLTNKLADEELDHVLKDGNSLDLMAKTFINRANELGGEDNISVAIVKYKSMENGSSDDQ